MRYRIKADKMKDLEKFGYHKEEYNCSKLFLGTQIIVGKKDRMIVKFDIEGDDDILGIMFYISDLIIADMVEEVE